MTENSNPMRIVISLFLVVVVTFLGYWLVLDERKHSKPWPTPNAEMPSVN